jgi:hypothetical protein
MDQHYWLDTYVWDFYIDMSPAYMDNWYGVGLESVRAYSNL